MDIIRKLVVEVSNKLSGANPNPKQQICVSAVADALGLQYYPDGKMLQELEGTDLSLTTGKDKNCVNCLAGTNRGVALRVFEYQFVTGCGPTECVHRQTVAWIDLEHDCLPEFQVKNKDFLSDFFGQPRKHIRLRRSSFLKRILDV